MGELRALPACTEEGWSSQTWSARRAVAALDASEPLAAGEPGALTPVQKHREPWTQFREVVVWPLGVVDFLRFTSSRLLSYFLCGRPLRLLGQWLPPALPGPPPSPLRIVPGTWNRTSFWRHSCSNSRRL